MLEGVDLSDSNKRTNRWPDFIIAKANEGTAKDSKWDQHSRNARRWGKPLGAYAFLRHPNAGAGTIQQQMTVFLSIAGDADLFGLDWEGKHRPTKAQTREAIDRVQQSGRKVALYASDSVYFDAGQDWTWIAHYDTTVWPTFNGRRADIWQYQGKPLDRDRFRGDIADLLALGGTIPPIGDHTMAGFAVKFAPGPIVSGTVSIDKGIEVFRLVDGTSYQLPGLATGRPAVKVVHDVPNGSFGYQVDLVGANGGSADAHFVRDTEATFMPSVSVDVKTAVNMALDDVRTALDDNRIP